MENSISVTVNNESHRIVYIGVQYGDEDLWLSIADEKQLAWISFDQDACIKKIDEGTAETPTKFDWNMIQYCSQQKQGIRMYVADQPLTGDPLDPMTTNFSYDKVEMGWNAIWNITNVDFFSIPMQLEGNNQKVGYKNNVSRSDVFKQLSLMPSPYNSLVGAEFINDPDLAGIIRYLSPVLYINSPFDQQLKDCFQNAITTGLPLLNDCQESFTYGDYTLSNFSVTVENDIKVDIKTNSTDTEATYTLSNINTVGVAGNIISVTPDDDAGETAAELIAAAIERGVLYDPKLWGQSGGSNHGFPADYYQDSLQNTNEYNHYAKVLHEFSICGLAYAFPFDDTFLQAPTIQFNEGDHATITIMRF